MDKKSSLVTRTDRETSDINALNETNTSRSQVEFASSSIEHHQNTSRRKRVWSQIGNNRFSSGLAHYIDERRYGLAVHYDRLLDECLAREVPDEQA